MSDEIYEKARRCWESKDEDSQMRCYLGMKGRVTIGQLLDHFADNYPHVDPMDVELNYSTAVWVEPPTADDRVQREAHRGWQAERQARWEANMYVKLKAKFEPKNPAA